MLSDFDKTRSSYFTFHFWHLPFLHSRWIKNVKNYKPNQQIHSLQHHLQSNSSDSIKLHNRSEFKPVLNIIANIKWMLRHNWSWLATLCGGRPDSLFLLFFPVIGVFQPLDGFLCLPRHRNWDIGRDPQVAPGFPYFPLHLLLFVHLQLVCQHYFMHPLEV